jgi:hypothetical protein
MLITSNSKNSKEPGQIRFGSQKTRDLPPDFFRSISLYTVGREASRSSRGRQSA